MVLRKSFPKFREAKIKGSSEKDIIKPPGTHKKQIELNSSSRQTDVFLLMIGVGVLASLSPSVASPAAGRVIPYD